MPVASGFLPVTVAIMLLLSVLADKGINPDGTLDKPTISKAYFEGEFWTVINALEAFRKSGFKGNREDSIYTFKYLSVVYAAEPSTRLKAESHMYQLIRMMPAIDLLDLYISDSIHSIFQKVKDDYDKIEGRHPGPVQAAAMPHPASRLSAPPSDPPAAGAMPAASADAAEPAARAKPPTTTRAGSASESSLKPWVPWALGGVGVVAAAFLMVSIGSDEGPADSRTLRPMDVNLELPQEGFP